VCDLNTIEQVKIETSFTPDETGLALLPRTVSVPLIKQKDSKPTTVLLDEFEDPSFVATPVVRRDILSSLIPKQGPGEASKRTAAEAAAEATLDTVSHLEKFKADGLYSQYASRGGFCTDATFRSGVSAGAVIATRAVPIIARNDSEDTTGDKKFQTPEPGKCKLLASEPRSTVLIPAKLLPDSHPPPPPISFFPELKEHLGKCISSTAVNQTVDWHYDPKPWNGGEEVGRHTPFLPLRRIIYALAFLGVFSRSVLSLHSPLHRIFPHLFQDLHHAPSSPLLCPEA
jgi:hypothetical protein